MFVDLKERDVVITRLMQQDHKRDEVGAHLLPERLLAAAKQIGRDCGDALGQSVGVQAVVQRVISIAREADLDIIGGTPVTLQDVLHVSAEAPFHWRIKALRLPASSPAAKPRSCSA